MNQIVHGFRAALFATGIALAFPTHAIPVPVGTTIADDLIVNFDFSSATPPPPYTTLLIQFVMVGWNAGENITFDVFDGLNGTSFDQTVVVNGPRAGVNFVTTTILGLLDGQFSFGLRLNTGAVDLSSETASGINAAGATANINGSVVPEPASLALLGIGLAGLGFSRRKQ